MVSKEYIDSSIKAKIDAKILRHQWDLVYYYKYRHQGLAGIDANMVKDQVMFNLRQLRVWEEIKNRAYEFSSIEARS